MKAPKYVAVLLMIIALASCGGGIGNQPINADGFAIIEKEIENKFGKDAYFTKITVMHYESIGNTVSLTVAEAPESLKMEEWNFVRGSWKQESGITIEIPEGTKASDFMFQLNEQINLSRLGGLVEKSTEQLTAEKNIENPRLEMAYVNFPRNGDISKAEYIVVLKPENGGTSFTFSYKLNGDFINMSY
ncbi:hypothetical protein [Hyunsoonleella ulvae]|uniref:hypothetical protein n=1 Tax=Hyunsoonleella ulvae TaxID=2799948 RepID=UPI001939B0F2|nr:hypothetical protein [Hyunsoonleella ulvae]